MSRKVPGRSKERRGVTRRKERRGGRSNEKEGAMKKKDQQRGRGDDEEGATMRKEPREESNKYETKKSVKDASLTTQSC